MPSASITPTMIVLPRGEPPDTLTWEVVMPGPEARSSAEYRTVQPARATATRMQPAKIPHIGSKLARAEAFRHIHGAPFARIVPRAEVALFTYAGWCAALDELVTLILERGCVACVSAYNAYQMAMNLKKVAFIDMH